MKALHDLVQADKVRYIGASSMWAYQFATMQFTAEKNGWTKFVSMQNCYSLLYREEEREMNKFCDETGVGLIPVRLDATSVKLLWCSSTNTFTVGSSSCWQPRTSCIRTWKHRPLQRQTTCRCRCRDHWASRRAGEGKGMDDESGCTCLGQQTDQ